MPRPLNTEWYWPASCSSTSRRVAISILRAFLNSSRGGQRHRRLRHREVLEDAADDVLGA